MEGQKILENIQTREKQLSGENERSEEKFILKYSDEDLNRIFDRKFARIMKKHEKELKEAKRLAKINAQKKAEYENKKLQDQLQKLLRKVAIFEISKSARAMLYEKKIFIGEELLSTLISEDAYKTRKSIENFITLFEKAVNDALKERTQVIG